MLSQEAKDRLVIALTSRTIGAEVAAAIEAGSNPQAAAVAAPAAVAPTFADLAVARTAVSDLRDTVAATLVSLKAAGVMASS